MPRPARGLGAFAPPLSLGAMKAWTSSIEFVSSKVPKRWAPPSTRTLEFGEEGDESLRFVFAGQG